MNRITIEVVKGFVCSVNNKQPYTIDGKHLKNKKYRGLIDFKDGFKVKVIYL